MNSVSNSRDDNYLLETQSEKQALLENFDDDDDSIVPPSVDSDGRSYYNLTTFAPGLKDSSNSEHSEYLPDSNYNSSDSCNDENSVEIPKQFFKLEINHKHFQNTQTIFKSRSQLARKTVCPVKTNMSIDDESSSEEKPQGKKKKWVKVKRLPDLC